MGTVKVWNGTAWKSDAKVWNGTAWKDLKVWDGTQWQPTATGPLTYQQEVMVDSPMVYLRFEETSGTVANDSSGNNHPGDYINAPTLNQTGLVPSDPTGKCAVFNGTTQRVYFGYQAWMDTQQATFESFINGTGAQKATAGWVNRDPGSGQRVFQMRFENGKLRILRFTSDSAFGDFWSTGTFSSGVVYHLAVVFDGAQALIYKNGVLDSAHSAPGGLRVGQTARTGLMNIEAGNWPSSTAMSGPMDEFAWYPTALSQARIQAHFVASGL